MPTLVPIENHVVGDVFTLPMWQEIQGDFNYLIQAGADLASAATVTITNEFHKVTGTTTVDNIGHAAPVAGQQARLWFTGALTVRNNGGGTGNIRTLIGVDRPVKANEIVVFIYDGALWREASPMGPGQEVAYTEFTGVVTATSSALTSGVSIVTATFIADGITAYLIEFGAPELQGSDNTNGASVFLFDGTPAAGTSLGCLAQILNGGQLGTPCYGRRKVIPTAGSHTFTAAINDAGAVTTVHAKVNAGTGATTGFAPGYMRISREV